MRFALIGIGYIAPRHMRAIKELGHELVACCDVHDTVGVLDSYFPEAAFFTEYERFDRHLEKLRRKGEGIDYLVVCTPNYLHDAHIRLGLRLGANVICEKPVVIRPWNIDALQAMEAESGKRVYPILQMRLHAEMQALKRRVTNGVHRVSLVYDTPRGTWYHYSWKGVPEKSGGLLMNIGIHFFDSLMWVFGREEHFTVDSRARDEYGGTLTLKRADVHWRLSTKLGQRRRMMVVDGQEFNFTQGFEDLHTESYRQILSGNGFTLEDTRAAIQLVHDMR